MKASFYFFIVCFWSRLSHSSYISQKHMKLNTKMIVATVSVSAVLLSGRPLQFSSVWKSYALMKNHRLFCKFLYRTTKKL